MELSIVIVNYNVCRLVKDCIESIYKFLDCVSFEIIVVDNNSSDGSAEEIRSNYPEVKIIQNSHNVGFSEATNQGIMGSRGNYILLLNPDTYLMDNSICSLYSFVKENIEIVAAPRLLNPDNSLQYSTWRDKDLGIMFQETFRIFRSTYHQVEFKSPQKVDNVSGAAMLFPRTIIEKVGLFDGNLFWMEDFDFCYRARKAGEPVYYFPDASIVHIGGQSSGTNRNIAYANSLISKVKFYKKHHPGFKAFLVSVLTLFHVIAYLCFLFLLAPFSSMYREKITSYLYTFKKLIGYSFNNNTSLTE